MASSYQWGRRRGKARSHVFGRIKKRGRKISWRKLALDQGRLQEHTRRCTNSRSIARASSQPTNTYLDVQPSIVIIKAGVGTRSRSLSRRRTKARLNGVLSYKYAEAKALRTRLPRHEVMVKVATLDCRSMPCVLVVGHLASRGKG